MRTGIAGVVDASQALTRALQETSRAMSVASARLEALVDEWQRQYERACFADPGLPAAWAEARRLDPTLGWLDVVVQRSGWRPWWRRALDSRALGWLALGLNAFTGTVAALAGRPLKAAYYLVVCLACVWLWSLWQRKP